MLEESISNMKQLKIVLKVLKNGLVQRLVFATWLLSYGHLTEQFDAKESIWVWIVFGLIVFLPVSWISKKNDKEE